MARSKEETEFLVIMAVINTIAAGAIMLFALGQYFIF